MATKFIVIDKTGNVDGQKTIDRLLGTLEEAFAQISEIAGVEEAEKGEIFPKQSVTVDPESKRRFVVIHRYIGSYLKANKKEANTGRASKADIPKLQKIYVDFARQNPEMPKGQLDSRVANLYEQETGDFLGQQYVAGTAKKHNWANLVSMVENVETVEA